MSDAKIGFEMRKRELVLEDILPVRSIKELKQAAVRYAAIKASLKEVGLVEPLVVYPLKGSPGKYQLLDGHLRLAALQELGVAVVECIVATDDECYTYNARVNRLPAVQEHKMIMKAVRNGVRPERIAAALNLQLRAVQATMQLMDGIHPEAAELLKDKPICGKAVRQLRAVCGVRQIEIVELMISAGNYTNGYAEALVLSTPKDQMVNPTARKAKKGMSAEEVERMEQEMTQLERGMKAIEESYGEDVLNLTLARAYVKKLLENGLVARYLKTHHADLLGEFEAIVAAETM